MGLFMMGGGVELQTTITKNPNLFSWIGKFDTLCKEIRGAAPNITSTEASTHIHMSISPKENSKAYFGSAMFRKTMIGNNWFSLFFRYNMGLSFFDSFNIKGRRRTDYGMGFEKNIYNKKVYFDDARFYNKRSISNVLRTGSYDRESLLRICGVSSTELHFEWRGTDRCPSAIFTGLKIELLQAIAKKAVALALDGKTLSLYPKEGYAHLEEANKVKNSSGIIHKVGRKYAALMLEELREYMSREAYKGLKAWVLFVDFLREDTGTKDWFEKYEAIIIKRIGLSHFLTNKELSNHKNFKKEKERIVPTEIAKEKYKKYEIILDKNTSQEVLFGEVEYDTYNPPKPNNKRVCPECGCFIASKDNKCTSCNKADNIVKKFSEKDNTTDNYKKIIQQLVSEPLSVRDI